MASPCRGRIWGCASQKQWTQCVLTFEFRPTRWGTRWRGDSAIWPRLSSAKVPADLWSAKCTKRFVFPTLALKCGKRNKQIATRTKRKPMSMIHLNCNVQKQTQCVFKICISPPRLGTRWRGQSAILPQSCAAVLPAIAAYKQRLREPFAVSHALAGWFVVPRLLWKNLAAHRGVKLV